MRNLKSMDVTLAILAGILILLGFLGSILPVLPGPPLSWAGLLVVHFSDYHDFTFNFLAIMFGIMAVVTALDYFIPIWGTKSFGGTRSGVTGATVGLLIGLFFGPVGIIAGPFVGALVGELIVNPLEFKKAMRSATGAFVGFLLGTGLKLAYAGFAIYYYIIALN